MKQGLAVAAAIVVVASAQCDWSTVDQAACRDLVRSEDCFPAGWPACSGTGTGATEGQGTLADILPASCDEVEFINCLGQYPDLENYLTCVHPEPCSCAGDFKFLECADAHCNDKSAYPADLTKNIDECRAAELTSTTPTSEQVVVANTSVADPNEVSTSTEIIPSTTARVQTTTTSTASSTGAAATMNVEMGAGAMAAAAIGFAAML